MGQFLGTVGTRRLELELKCHLLSLEDQATLGRGSNLLLMQVSAYHQGHTCSQQARSHYSQQQRLLFGGSLGTSKGGS